MQTNYKIITFLSYKGGVGRSLTLVNIAYALAKEGKRVGCIDLDLDAPGLNMLFNTNYVPTEQLTTANILATGRTRTVDASTINVAVQASGELYLLPAINQPEIVSRIDWSKTGKAIMSLRETCRLFAEKNKLDVILLDSKAGLGPSSGLALSLAQLSIIIFRIDKQCREGTIWMHKIINKAHGKPSLFIPSMIPNIKQAEKIIKSLKKDLRLEMSIPYTPSMVIEEKIVVRDSFKSKTALIYINLAKKILRKLNE